MYRLSDWITAVTMAAPSTIKTAASVSTFAVPTGKLRVRKCAVILCLRWLLAENAASTVATSAAVGGAKPTLQPLNDEEFKQAPTFLTAQLTCSQANEFINQINAFATRKFVGVAAANCFLTQADLEEHVGLGTCLTFIPAVNRSRKSLFSYEPDAC